MLPEWVQMAVFRGVAKSPSQNQRALVWLGMSGFHFRWGGGGGGQ